MEDSIESLKARIAELENFAEEIYFFEKDECGGVCRDFDGYCYACEAKAVLENG